MASVLTGHHHRVDAQRHRSSRREDGRRRRRCSSAIRQTVPTNALGVAEVVRLIWSYTRHQVISYSIGEISPSWRC